jgi:hypothetical protein
MIIVRLIGGLGNQMFQYACGRALSEKMNARLYFDLSGFKYYRLHGYGLDKFNVKVDKAPWYLSLGTRLCALARRLGLTNARYLSIFSVKYLDEAGDLLYRSQRMVFDGDAYLNGYWQSSRYFDDCAAIIRKEFRLSESLIDSFMKSKIELGIGNGATVSVHIRRGDYVTDKSANQTHGLLPDEYYQKAILYLKINLRRKFKLVIFSDDIDWVKHNFDIPLEVVYVQANKLFPQIDLYLMAACDHHIIANSSFSWWGAWLNTSPSKVVIAPLRWFNSEYLVAEDICPLSWIRL